MKDYEKIIITDNENVKISLTLLSTGATKLESRLTSTGINPYPLNWIWLTENEAVIIARTILTHFGVKQ